MPLVVLVVVSLPEFNFKGTCVRPGNPWDLRRCRQAADEPLRDFARRFSKQRLELPHVLDEDVISAFLAGTTCQELVHELGRYRPRTVEDLMDRVTICIIKCSGRNWCDFYLLLECDLA